MQESQLEYVGFWARTGAALIDTILLIMIVTPLLFSIYGWSYFHSEKIIQGPADFFISWVIPIAAIIAFWVKKQATPGKMVFSARIVDARTGRGMTPGQAVGRYLAYFVSILPLGLGILWVAFDARKQGWHDKIAGTVVVRQRALGTQPVSFE